MGDNLRILGSLLKSEGYGGREGKAGIGTLIFLLIVIAIIYVGVKIAPPLIRYYEVRNLFGVNASMANRSTDQEILGEINRGLKEIKAPIDPNDVLIRREGGTFEISATYKERVTFVGGRYEKIFTFNPQASVSF